MQGKTCFFWEEEMTNRLYRFCTDPAVIFALLIAGMMAVGK